MGRAQKLSLRTGAALMLATVLVACGGKGGSTTASSTPVVANLGVSFGAQCTLASGLAGTRGFVTFEFVDAEGDLSGGRVVATATFDVGGPITITFNIPSPEVTVSGTTSGTVTLLTCIRFGSSSSAILSGALFDAANQASNTLTLSVQRPAGAPEAPRSGGAFQELRW
ncbi:MAG: hypothetical protein ACRELA_14335 [Candidatus Rokuibacteriota bacterium]